VHKCGSYHLFLHIDGEVDLSLIIIPLGLCCMLCVQSIWTTIMLMCDQHSTNWHMQCVMSFLAKVLIGNWVCLWCRKEIGTYISMVCM
jgi:hypothetical protein